MHAGVCGGIMQSLVCCAFLLLTALSSTDADRNTNYLVLGGNGLLGGELVSRLRLRNAADVTIVNRGNWYWDSLHRIKPFVTHVQCDRHSIKSCSMLLKVAKEKFFFDVVFDFSSYSAQQLRDFLDIMRHRIGRYVYISSDSVYEVCKNPSHWGPSREEDAIRPGDLQTQQGLADLDRYGHNKLACEEVLQEESQVSKLPYMSLRIPDMIGPRDNTDRFWMYFLWVKFQDVFHRPVYYPPYLHGQQLSFVFSEDVAILMNILPDMSIDFFNGPYNLACRETVTLQEFITLLGRYIGVSDVLFDTTTVKGTHYYPSIKRGPVNITKAEKLLSWNPHSLYDAVKKTAQFYNYAMTASEFKQQRDGIVEAFVPQETKEKFEKKFKEIYGTKRFLNEL